MIRGESLGTYFSRGECNERSSKNAEGSKKAFIEWIPHIPGKIRGEQPLTDIEEKYANITGLFASCSGVNIPELGFGKRTKVKAKARKIHLIIRIIKLRWHCCN
ncbi:uncharacterized protein LOC108906022 [Anoplophora glabripennis]|uniref:uncharacterized protein LOC108906022 n=1 Tax=Anoplophora glabripennis TaxID=217634 RepID=UPI0008743264|nr:uncharacterized protein LOC108906022 [Anoplophora glabripennis]